MYCLFPNISKLPLGLNIFVLPVESIEDGSYDIALLTIAILVPFLPGSIFGLILASRGKGTNLVELGIANGAVGMAKVLLLNRNETVCGSSGAIDGTLQTTVLPALISTRCGSYP